MRRRLTAVFLGLSLLTLPACSSFHPHSAPTSTTTAEASSPNPDVVPPVITPAYVNAVFKVLEHIDGNASRELLATKAVTPSVLADIRAIYNDPLYQQEVQIAQESLQGELSNVRNPPGDVVVTATRILSASPSCIFVSTSSDYRAVLIDPGPAVASEYWTLRPKQSGADPQHLNSTYWALAFNADYKEPTTIPDQCVGS